MLHHRFANATKHLLCKTNLYKLENMKNRPTPTYLRRTIAGVRVSVPYLPWVSFDPKREEHEWGEPLAKQPTRNPKASWRRESFGAHHKWLPYIPTCLLLIPPNLTSLGIYGILTLIKELKWLQIIIHVLYIIIIIFTLPFMSFIVHYLSIVGRTERCRILVGFSGV